MDSNIPLSNAESNKFLNSMANPGVRPLGVNPNNSTQESKSLRMEQMHSDGRNEANVQQNNQPLLQNLQHTNIQQQNIMHQNQQLHQNTMQQNQRLQQQNNMPQQQNLRFPTNENLHKIQTNSAHNNQPPNSSMQNNQRSPRPPFESQKIQMGPQIRHPGSQQLQRPPFNKQINGISLHQRNQPRMEAPRPPSEQIRPNLQNMNHLNNYNVQFSKNPSVNLTRKSSDLDIKPPTMTSTNNADVKPQMRAQTSISSNSNRIESKSDLLNDGIPSQSETEAKSETKEPRNGLKENDKSKKFSLEENDKSKKFSLEKTESSVSIDTKTKEKIKEVNKNNTIHSTSITSGIVQKNIKFFEENDTAKTPLTPPATTNTTKRTEKIKNPPSDVIRAATSKDEYESGVDETPVIHPNLRSIFQVPRKVAKVPFLKSKKRSRKSESEKIFTLKETSTKKQFRQRPIFSDNVFSPSHSGLHHKSSNRKNQKKNIYGSKEELLAFFENTKSWRKPCRYGSKTDQRTTRDKVMHKPTTNGDIPTPKKTPSKQQIPSKKNLPLSPTKTPLKSPGTPGTPGTKSLPKTPESPAPSTPLIKKVPMNKIQVGAAPSPNLKTVKSKVGSLINTTHKPGGGNVKIESHKIDLSNVQPRTEAKNDQYKRSGGDKKIQQVKLQWNATSKVGSLENATYKPGGGDKKIESIKLDFKEKAKPKVGSKDNVKHTPGGGNVKIENQKLEFKAQSKVGSLDNVKHKPGGGDIKIFDDKTYLRQVSGNSSEGRASGTQAFKEFSVIREVEGRSAPGTPGRNTSIKIRKMTSIDNSDELPKIKKITEVTVTSVTPKKERKADRSPTKVKLTYSKISSLKNDEPENFVKLITIPAKNDAPVLKPRLSKKDLSNGSETGKQLNGNEFKHDFDKTSLYIKNAESSKQISGSPGLSEDKSNSRDDSEISKFLQDEIATHEKIGEMWLERNALDNNKSNLTSKQQHGEQLKELQTSSENFRRGGNNQQFESQNPNIKFDTRTSNVYDSRSSDVHPNQNLQSEKISKNPSLVQSHPQNQQKPQFPSSVQDGYRISPSLQNQSFTTNLQFQQNVPK